MIRPQEVAAILGLTQRKIQEMVETEKIRPVRGPNIDGYGKRLYLRSDIEELAAEKNRSV